MKKIKNCWPWSHDFGKWQDWKEGQGSCGTVLVIQLRYCSKCNAIEIRKVYA